MIHGEQVPTMDICSLAWPGFHVVFAMNSQSQSEGAGPQHMGFTSLGHLPYAVIFGNIGSDVVHHLRTGSRWQRYLSVDDDEL
jgi:hypothetical protein